MKQPPIQEPPTKMRAEVLEKALLLSSGSKETLFKAHTDSCAHMALTSPPPWAFVDMSNVADRPITGRRSPAPPCKPSRDNPPIRHLGPILFLADAGRADPVVPASFLALTPNN